MTLEQLRELASHTQAVTLRQLWYLLTRGERAAVKAQACAIVREPKETAGVVEAWTAEAGSS